MYDTSRIFKDLVLVKTLTPVPQVTKSSRASVAKQLLCWGTTRRSRIPGPEEMVYIFFSHEKCVQGTRDIGFP